MVKRKCNACDLWLDSYVQISSFNCTLFFAFLRLSVIASALIGVSARPNGTLCVPSSLLGRVVLLHTLASQERSIRSGPIRFNPNQFKCSAVKRERKKRKGLPYSTLVWEIPLKSITKDIGMTTSKAGKPACWIEVRFDRIRLHRYVRILRPH